MTVKKNKINKVLDTLLNKKAIQELSEKGDIPKLTPDGKPGDVRRFSIELAIYCGHRAERVMKRDLLKMEFKFVTDAVKRFLKKTYMA
jgi:hypothetical protein